EMEDFPTDPKEEYLIQDYGDEFYEEIEAPKFVDFTDPDRSRPDDSSWFCVRIGRSRSPSFIRSVVVLVCSDSVWDLHYP
ncbi:hypothetical protein PJP10_32735, partial [Mycobacterium kansasii]